MNLGKVDSFVSSFGVVLDGTSSLAELLDELLEELDGTSSLAELLEELVGASSFSHDIINVKQRSKQSISDISFFKKYLLLI